MTRIGFRTCKRCRGSGESPDATFAPLKCGKCNGTGQRPANVRREIFDPTYGTLIVTMEAGTIVIREKKRRKGFTLTYGAVYQHGAMQEATRKMRERARARKERKAEREAARGPRGKRRSR